MLHFFERQRELEPVCWFVYSLEDFGWCIKVRWLELPPYPHAAGIDGGHWIVNIFHMLGCHILSSSTFFGWK